MAYDMVEVASAYSTLSKLVKADLDVEFEEGRIKGTEYANVYNQLMSNVLQLSMQAPTLGKQVEVADKDIELKDKQIEKIDKDIQLVDSEITLKACQEELTCAQKDKTLSDTIITQEQSSADLIIKEKEALIKDEQINLTAAQTIIAEKDALIKDEQVKLTKIQTLNGEKDLLVKDEDIATAQEQQQLYSRQREGFDDDIRRKMLDIQMNTWGIMFSSGLLEEKPAMICDDAVTDLYAFMSDKAGVPYVPGDCPEDTLRGNNDNETTTN